MQCCSAFGLANYESPTYDKYTYPPWAIGIGWMIAAASVILIPLTAIYKIASTPGSLYEVGRWIFYIHYGSWFLNLLFLLIILSSLFNSSSLSFLLCLPATSHHFISITLLHIIILFPFSSSSLSFLLHLRPHHHNFIFISLPIIIILSSLASSS